MESARPHLIVIRLQDQAALRRPIALQGENKVLKSVSFGHRFYAFAEWPEPTDGLQTGQARRRAAAPHRSRMSRNRPAGAEPAPAAGRTAPRSPCGPAQSPAWAPRLRAARAERHKDPAVAAPPGPGSAGRRAKWR